MIHSQEGIDEVMLAPQGITDGATVTANLDTRGYDYAVIRLLMSAEEGTDATNSTISLLQDDTTVVTSFSTLVANISQDNTAAAEQRYEVDLLGKERYLRLSFTAGTQTASNITVAAIATKFRNDTSPASATAMGDDNVTVL